ncbi:hypothetical protein H5407_16055 [Mitsuaria sp. WAJ17]|uniref:hypothetical protein n=1 Tax=Mitsuaria sp. WAJ17 TaxID=2761452 RepID=UPI0015FFCB1C|nr:hypothetical protein [Mitsuaria sp. WAJ17]MBB2486740.1 hypothetical protein [Mitsuaria sp. WAJ17]
MALSQAPEGGAAEAQVRVDALGAQAAVQRAPWRHSVRGDLLERQHRGPEAALALEQAAALSLNEREHALLTQRALEARSKDEETGAPARGRPRL